MTEISGKAIDSFGATGGILGLIILSLILLILVVLYAFYWYIKTDREHKFALSKHNADQYEKRLDVERQLIDAIHLLVVNIKGRPCMRGDTDRIPSQTRRYEQ